jgi:hypothetical protein
MTKGEELRHEKNLSYIPKKVQQKKIGDVKFPAGA